MGVKNLFLFDPTGMVHEKKSLCVLDFYVHKSKQRNGLGKQMFDFMLEVRISYSTSSTISNLSYTPMDYLSVKLLLHGYNHYFLHYFLYNIRI
jgi:GNAT superfamily N-acetyltransferase